MDLPRAGSREDRLSVAAEAHAAHSRLRGRRRRAGRVQRRARRGGAPRVPEEHAPLAPGRRERNAPAFGAKHTSSKPSFSPVNPPVNPVNPAPPPEPSPAPPLDTTRAARPTRASSTSTASESGDVVARNALSAPPSAPPPPHAREDSVLCTLPLSPSPRLVHLGWNRSPSETRSVSKGSTHKPPDAHAAARNPPLASKATETAGSPNAAAAVVSRRARGRCVTPSSRKFPRDNPNASWLRRSHARLASYGRRVFLEVPGGVFRFRASVSSSSVVTFVSTFVSTFASPRAFVRAYASTRYSYAHLLSAALASASRRARVSSRAATFTVASSSLRNTVAHRSTFLAMRSRASAILTGGRRRAGARASPSAASVAVASAAASTAGSPAVPTASVGSRRSRFAATVGASSSRALAMSFAAARGALRRNPRRLPWPATGRASPRRAGRPMARFARGAGRRAARCAEQRVCQRVFWAPGFLIFANLLFIISTTASRGSPRAVARARVGGMHSLVGYAWAFSAAASSGCMDTLRKVRARARLLARARRRASAGRLRFSTPCRLGASKTFPIDRIDAVFRGRHLLSSQLPRRPSH